MNTTNANVTRNDFIVSPLATLTPKELVVVTTVSSVPSSDSLVATVGWEVDVGVIGTMVVVADGWMVVARSSSKLVTVTSMFDTVPSMLRFLRFTGPKHDGSSLKSLREQSKNAGHG